MWILYCCFGKNNHLFAYLGNQKPWRVVLLYGPPAIGKNLVAKAIAAEAK